MYSVANGSATTTFSAYDALGRVKVSSQSTSGGAAFGFSYTYDLAGDLLTESYPDGRVLTTTYDNVQRPITLSGVLSGGTTNYITQAYYWPNSTPWYFVRGNTVWHVNAINSRMQVPEIYEAVNNSNTLGTMLFVSCPNWGTNPSNYGAYDICPHATQTNNNGNMQSYAEYLGGPSYLSQKVFSQTFGYDGLSPATNQNGNLSYDTAGNQLTTVTGATAAYNAGNEITSISNATTSMLYDGFGRRVQKTYNGTATNYVYDAFGLATEYRSGAWLKDYISDGARDLVASENAAGGACTTCYYGGDHLGSTRLVTDQNHNIVFRHDYLPFGEEIYANVAGRDSTFAISTSSDVTEKFTGQIRDQESSQDYFNARFFTPAFGRFNSPDPGSAGADQLSSQSWNAYGYVPGNPLNAVDPSGMGTTCTAQNNYCGESFLANPGFTDAGVAYDEFGTLSMTSSTLLAIVVVIPPDQEIQDSNFGQNNVFALYSANSFSATISALQSAFGLSYYGGANNAQANQNNRQTKCTGRGRGLAGNARLVGRQGGIPGQTVHLGTAAVIPQQFGLPSGAALAPYASSVYGVIGNASFSSLTDVVGGRPIQGVAVRTALQLRFPGQLILEIPGAPDQGANAAVTVYVPRGLACPTGTSAAGGN